MMMGSVTPDKDKATSLREAVASVFSAVGKRQKSVISAEQVLALMRIFTFADAYKSKKALRIGELLMELKVSERARGRDDLVKALQAVLATEKKDDEHAMDMSLKRRLLGG
jgi:hypothetical protein